MARRRVLLLLLVVNTLTQCWAQETVTLPRWMAATLGGERMKERTFKTEEIDLEQRLGQQLKRLGFIGTYSLELAVEDSARLDCKVTGWQDSTRAIVIVEGISQPLRTTYMADLKADVALYAHSEDGQRTALVGRISNFLRPEAEAPEPPRRRHREDSLISTRSTVLARTCQEWTRLRIGGLILPVHNRVHYWVDTTITSPFAEMPGWLPLYGRTFEALKVFTALRPGIPLKIYQGRSLMRMTRLSVQPGPPPAVDLRDYSVTGTYRPPTALHSRGEAQYMDDEMELAYGRASGQPAAAPEFYTYAEQMPQFPGGEEAFKAYLTTNLRYPEMEREIGIQGTVYLSIIVEPNGAVTNIAPLREVSGAPALTKEAIRLLKAMPPWTPGRTNGKPVRVKMNVPVKFRLE